MCKSEMAKQEFAMSFLLSFTVGFCPSLFDKLMKTEASKHEISKGELTEGS